MGQDLTIDTLSIEIESKSDNVGKGIEKLASQLLTLRNATSGGFRNLQNLSNYLTNLKTSATGLSSVSKELQNLESVASSLNSLTNIGKATNLKSVFKQLEALPNINNKLDSKMVVEFTDKLDRLTSALLPLNHQLERTGNGFAKLPTKINKVTNHVVKQNSVVKKGTSVWSVFTKGLSGSIAKLTTFAFGVKQTTDLAGKFLEQATGYEEALNLFTVTLGKYAKQGQYWMEKFSNSLHLDPNELMQYMGAFNSLVKGLGVGSEKSYLISKNITQLVYDLASFKNLSIETAFTKLQSAMSGEIEPLRNTGVALSQATLQELAYSLGIKENVANLNEATKAQLRYIQIIRSSVEWQGDMARTLVTPANALRVMQQEFKKLSRAIGSIFIPLVMKALPYVIALTQVLTDFANRIASFFGYKIADIDYSSLQDGTEILEGVEEQANATGKAIKGMLAPFDDLNVVLDTKTGSGSAGSKFNYDLDLPEYDALKGLTDQLDKNVEKARENLNGILDIAKKLGIAFAIIWGGSKLLKFGDALGDVFTLFKTGNTSSKILSNGLKTLITRFKDGYKFSKAFGGKGLTPVVDGFREMLTPIQKVTVAIGASVVSFGTAYSMFADVAQGTKSVGEAMTATIPTVGLLTGAMYLLTGPWGALATAIAGVVGGVRGYINEMENMIYQNAIDEAFSKGVVTIDKLTNALRESNEELVNSTNRLQGWKEEMESNDVVIDESAKDIEYYIQKLRTTGELTETELNNMKNSFASLSNGVKSNFELVTRSVLEVFSTTLKGVVKQTGVDLNTIATDIFNFQSMFDTTTSDLEKQISKLEKKVTLGTISESEMDKLVKLYEKYANLNTVATELDGKFYNLSNELSTMEINFENVDDAKTKIEELGDVYSTMTKNLSSSKDLAVANINAMIDKIPEIVDDPAKQEALKKSFEGYRQQIINGFEIKQEELANQFAIVTNNIQVGLDKAIEDAVNNAKEQPILDYLRKIYGLDTTKDKAKDEITQMLKPIQDALDETATDIGKNASVGLSNGITSNMKLSEEALDGLLNTMKITDTQKSEIKKLYYDYGYNTIAGLIAGIEYEADKPSSQMKDVSTEMGNAIIEYFDMHSPSKKTYGFGTNIIEGLTNGLNDSKTDAVTAISDLNKALEAELLNNPLKITIDDNLESSFNSILNKLQNFTNKFRSGINSLLSNFTKAMNGVYVGSDNKIYYSKMPTISIPKFEDGGYPDKASLFWANENGVPELIGRIGNQTAVANNEQITTAMTNALVTALATNKGTRGNTIVYIGNEKVYEGMGDYFDDNSDRYGTTYIDI